MPGLWNLSKRVFREFNEDRCTEMAAAISYHVLFSFIPFVTVLLAMFGLLMHDPQQRQSVAERMLHLVPLRSTIVVDAIRNISSQTGALTLIGTLGLIWAAGGIVSAVRGALNVAWDVPKGRGFVRETLFDLGAVLALGIVLGTSLAGTTAFHVLQLTSLNPSIRFIEGPLKLTYALVGVLLPALFSFIAFVLVYRYVPNVRHRVRDVWPGAMIATLLFEVIKHGFGFYAAHFNSYPTVYGAIGEVMLFMLWTYLSSVILLIGAEVSSEWERERRVIPELKEPAPLPTESAIPAGP
jgi:membrane protein